MERISEGGVWQCFIPDKVKEYDVYRYAVTTQDGEVLMKADPYAYHYETRPPMRPNFTAWTAMSGTTTPGINIRQSIPTIPIR